MGRTTQASINTFFGTAKSQQKSQKPDSKLEISGSAPDQLEEVPAKREHEEPGPLEDEQPPRKKLDLDTAATAKELIEEAVNVPLTQISEGSTIISGVKVSEEESLPYLALTNTFEKAEATTKRLEINAICSEFFLDILKTRPHELPKVTYLFINRLGPDYEGLELGLGESLIMKALQQATSKTLAQLRADYRKTGDLGLVALHAKSAQSFLFSKPKPLTVSSVFESLKNIAAATGSASQNRKIEIIQKLLLACQGTESKFLVRSLEGKLRIGIAEKSVLTALAHAFVYWEFDKDTEGSTSKAPTPEDITKGEDLIKEAYAQMPNYEVIINAMIEHGVAKVTEICKVAAGIPLKPMLAKPTKSITEVLDRVSGVKFTCEYKYDGERAQVHYESGTQKFHVYSRNMEDMTQRYPDIISILPKILKESKENSSFILDCEAVAWDRDQKKILPFQKLSTRKRKDVLEDSIEIRVCLFAFDILYYNGESLLHRPLEDRREILKTQFQPVEGEFQFVNSMVSENLEDIQTFLDQSVKDNCEGLMIKVMEGSDSAYEPSKRSRNWLKLKKDYLSGVGDTLDLVVLGAYYGRGKRTNWYGGFLLGCYNPDTEEFETVCKIGTGFSEENLEKFYNELSPTVIETPKSYVLHEQRPNALPNVWFEPKMVWEVLTADLSLSPIYKAGIHELGQGVSLRFPRFIRVRDDKGPNDATTSEQIVEFYQRQADRANTGNLDDE